MIIVEKSLVDFTKGIFRFHWSHEPARWTVRALYFCDDHLKTTGYSFESTNSISLRSALSPFAIFICNILLMQIRCGRGAYLNGTTIFVGRRGRRGSDGGRADSTLKSRTVRGGAIAGPFALVQSALVVTHELNAMCVPTECRDKQRPLGMLERSKTHNKPASRRLS